MTTVAIELLVESGRALGEGAKTDQPLEIVPLVCVACASKSKQDISHWDVTIAHTLLQSPPSPP